MVKLDEFIIENNYHKNIYLRNYPYLSIRFKYFVFTINVSIYLTFTLNKESCGNVRSVRQIIKEIRDYFHLIKTKLDTGIDNET